MVRSRCWLALSLIWLTGCSWISFQAKDPGMGVRVGVVQSFVQELGRPSDRQLIKLFTKSARLEIVGLGVVAPRKKELKEFLVMPGWLN